MNVNVTFGQGDSEFPVKIGATDNGMDVDFGNTQLIKGDKGDDGFSPVVDITPIDGGHRISITDKDGTETADVMDGKDGADGYTPVKGVDYFDGDPGADGISPTVAVQDITGGHRVTITDKDGAKTFDVMDGKDGKDGAGGSGGDCAAIIDVTELPADTDVQKDVFYRLTKPEPYTRGNITQVPIILVDALPETGEPFVNLENGLLTLYLVTGSFSIYAYLSAELGEMAGLPAMWLDKDTANQLMAMAGFDYKIGDVVYDYNDIPNDENITILVSREVYVWKNELLPIQSVGRLGETDYAEAFNSPLNEASGFASHAEGLNTKATGYVSHSEGEETLARGEYAHAEGFVTSATGASSHTEGYDTTASGYYAHAEGNGTEASENASHAEGINTTASGLSSHAEGESSKALGDEAHAEGYYTTASGTSSHAEGEDTTAAGDNSHAEGAYTIALGACQHVQGRYNIEDGDKNDRLQYGQYIHIVGNGWAGGNRSNAHTLDWNGNAWFSGSVYVGSTSRVNRDEGSRKLVANGDSEIILTSPSGTRYRLTVADDGTLTTAAV